MLGVALLAIALGTSLLGLISLSALQPDAREGHSAHVEISNTIFFKLQMLGI